MNLKNLSAEVDILAIGVHPDDIELSCAGTLLNHIKLGYSCGLLDLTKGELGTRGNAVMRSEEAYLAADILGAKFRIQLDLSDAFFDWDKESILKIIQVIRTAKPKVIFANAISDRHPDHGRAAKLIADAVFYSGLQKIETLDSNSIHQSRWRTNKVLHYIQDYQLKPHILMDISEVMERKLAIIQCFKSQFFDPNSNEADSPISGKDFFEVIRSNHRVFGRLINVAYAEGFNTVTPWEVKNLIL